jgi:hypothetical protein
MTDPITLADHAGARLTHGKPTVNGVEIHYAIGGGGIDEMVRSVEQPSGVRGAVIPESGHNIAPENPAALARAYLDFFASR